MGDAIAHYGSCARQLSNFANDICNATSQVCLLEYTRQATSRLLRQQQQTMDEV
jgi:hypothetical protein